MLEKSYLRPVPSIKKIANDFLKTAKKLRASFAATGTWNVNTDIYREDYFLACDGATC